MTKFLIYSTLFLCIVLALVPHILFALSWLVGKCARFSVPYRPFGWTAVGLVALCLVVIAYGNLVGLYRTTVKEVTFTHEQVPAAFDGYRIVQISDLHVSTFERHPERLQQTIDKINALRPDLICFTGDLVSMTTDEVTPFVEILRSLRAKDGVISVLGNHDYATYVHSFSEEQKAQAVARLIETERNVLGWNLLLNESQMLVRDGDTLSVLGSENQSCGGNGISPIKRGNLAQALSGTGGFRVLLTHDPTHWRGEVLGTDIPLTLSGHTHAAQFRIFGWTPARWIYPDSDGLYTEGSQSLYVNTGIGCTVPFRVGVPQEITVITLAHKQ